MDGIGRFNRFTNRVLIATATLAFFCSTTAFAQFETRVTYPAFEPFYIATGDFNGDGKLDVALADNGLTVYLGNGDGTFSAPTNYHSDNVDASVVAADLNQDGKLDLAMGGSLGVSVFIGNGDGTFQPEVLYDSNFYVGQVSAADLNKDGNLDVVVNGSTNFGAYIGILFGNGDGTFQPIVSIHLALGGGSFGLGDFNGDGNLDIATLGATIFGAEIQILLGKGNGNFTMGSAFSVGTDAGSVTVADFNRDGSLDLAIPCDNGVNVLLGNGDGTFQPAVIYFVLFPRWASAADLNGDGKVDLAVTQFLFPAGISTLLGNGDGTFQPPTYYPTSNGADFVAIGDLNGDHKPDLVVTTRVNSHLITFLNTGVVNLSPPTALQFATQVVGTVSQSQTVTLTNTGKTPLSISAIIPSGPFSRTSTCSSNLGPGAKCAITISFVPTMRGTASGTISIKDSASAKPQVIALLGTGTVVSLAPTALTFGDQKVGTSSLPQTVTLTNTGNTVLNITKINLGGPNAQDFSQTTTCSSQVSPGGSCSFSVTFTPTKVGSRSATLSITDDGGGSPQKVLLSGPGT